jgi:Bacterial regulatory proteins, tetR family.
VCSEAGVSRRTFFNYFASKENAVLGIPARTDASDLDEAFAVGHGPLIGDLAELFIARWERLSLTKEEAAELGRVFRREPRLFAHFAGLAAQGERDDVELVRRRPDAVGTLHAETVVQLLGALVRPTVVEYFETDASDFRALFLRRVDAARELFSL